MKKISSLIICLALLTTGCSNSANSKDNSGNLGIVRFEKDSLSERIIRTEGAVQDSNEENPYDTVLENIAPSTTSTTRKDNKTPEEVEETNKDTTDKSFNEIHILGQDTSKLYKKSGNDIIFNNVKYEGLSRAVDIIEVPCDKRTFINFIVKTYSTESEVVDVLFSEDYSRTENTLSSTLDSEFNEIWDGYSGILKKYGTPVMWMLMFSDGVSNSILYGNKDYIIYKGKNGNLEINMSFYDEGGYVEDDVVEESKPDETSRDIEETNESNKESNDETEDEHRN